MDRRPQDRTATSRSRFTLKAAVAGCAGLLAWGAAALWLAGPAVGPAAAAPPPPAAPGFAESSQVTAVEIPVQVSKDGQPVRGLTAADFEVYDGRNRQTITGFDMVDLSLPASQALSAPIPVEARRHFMLLFDLAFSEPKSILKARDAAREVMLKQLVPSDLVAVATYASSTGPRMVLGFTSDRRQIASAIDHLGLPELVDRSPDPLQLVADDVKSNILQDSRALENSGVKGTMQQILAQSLQESARASERANRESQMSIVSGMTRSLADLGRLMASVSGRKQVVYFSEGFNSSFLEGAESKTEQDAMSQQSQFGLSQNVDSDARFGSTHQNNQLEAMLESFRRSDCVIQAVDIGGLRAQGDMGPTRASGEATLFQMAKDTGGELFRSFNDLGAAMDRLLKQTSVTYVLTIQPAELKHDGQYHKLRVQLKNGSRSVQVSSRAGFYAPVAYAKENPLAKKLAAADALMSAGRAGTVDLAVLAAPFRSALDKAYVPVVIEAGGPSLMAGGEGPSLPVEIYAYAIDAQGQIQDYFDQAMRFDTAKAPPALRQAGLKFFGHLELGPGEYWLRVLVRNGATGAYGMRAERLIVPAFGEPAVVVLRPFFPEVPGRWMIVREPPRGAQNNAAYPFMIEDHPYIPASRPELAPGQELPLALMGYNWGAGGLNPAARVESADGRDLGPAALQVAGRAPGNGAKPDEIKESLRIPAGLVPGEYRLVVTLTPPAGSAAAGGAVQAASSSFSVVAAKGAGGGT
jgi:VWFA-related protein